MPFLWIVLLMLSSCGPAIPPSSSTRPDDIASLRAPRHALASVVVGEKVVVLGGWQADAGGFLASVEVYDPKQNAWVVAAPFSSASAFLGAASLGGQVFVAGGLRDGDEVLDRFERWRPGDKEWTALPNLPEGRSRLTLTTHEGRLYAIGGSSRARNVARVDVFDPKTGIWSVAPPLAIARHGHRTVVWRDRLWVIGGYGSEGILASVEVLSADGTRWESGPKLNHPRGFFVAVARSNGLWISHGRVPLEYPRERLTRVEGPWEPVGVAQHAHSRCGVVQNGEEVWLIGGESDGSATTVHRFDLETGKCTTRRADRWR